MKNIVENQGIKTDKPLPMSYEALKAERDAQQKRADALAVENAELKAAAADLRRQAFNGRRNSHNCGPFQYSDLCESIIDATKFETPATSAALAAIEARGVERAAEALDALSAQSASATTQGNFRAAAVYLRTTVLPAIGEAK
ncbi:hypothetical protein [Serratia marcescens]|uniref:hypothetical protein n=1 Tax=Serratia marcescens TaxID=615 RepID=UPI003A88454C